MMKTIKINIGASTHKIADEMVAARHNSDTSPTKLNIIISTQFT